MNAMSEITYRLMPDDAELAKTLAKWNIEFWSDKVDSISEQNLSSIYLFAARTPENKLPKTLVAYVNGELAGAVTLGEKDLPQYPMYKPWLGSLIVHPKFQELGIGREITLEAQRLAKKMGFSFIYCFTATVTEWALRWHWEVIHQTTFKGLEVNVMKKSLHWDYLN
jgi:ribosomal protein S18 acetylase RimI-like enzyme